MSNNFNIKVENATGITPYNHVLYEAGKSIYIDSLNNGREFCKFMITISTGAIPIYIALLQFILPKDCKLNIIEGLLAALPGFLFIFSTIFYIYGYSPKSDILDLDNFNDIQRVRTALLDKRKYYTDLGNIFFIVSSFILVGICCYFLTFLKV